VDTILGLLLIRFGAIVGGLVVLALLAFGAAVVLKHRGALDQTRRRVAPVARAVARRLDDRNDRQRRSGASRGRGMLASAAVRAAAGYLQDDRRDPRRRG
jgi:hypothetical protein